MKQSAREAKKSPQVVVNSADIARMAEPSSHRGVRGSRGVYQKCGWDRFVKLRSLNKRGSGLAANQPTFERCGQGVCTHRRARRAAPLALG